VAILVAVKPLLLHVVVVLERAAHWGSQKQSTRVTLRLQNEAAFSIGHLQIVQTLELHLYLLLLVAIGHPFEGVFEAYECPQGGFFEDCFIDGDAL